MFTKCGFKVWPTSLKFVFKLQYKAPMPGKRRNSPPRTFPLSKTWSQNSLNSVMSSTPPISQQQGVKVTGTAMPTHQRNNEAKKSLPLPSHSEYNGDNKGMIHSTSWEWVTPNSTLDQAPKANSKLLPKRSVNVQSKKQHKQLDRYCSCSMHALH